MSKTIQFTTTYNHPVEKIWIALTDSKAMSQWLMPCDIKAEVGHQFQFRTKPSMGFNGIIDCEVLEVIYHKKISFSWISGSLKNSKVDFVLEPKGNQTILHFEHSGFEGFLNKILTRRILATGWKKKLLSIQLPNYLNQ